MSNITEPWQMSLKQVSCLRPMVKTSKELSNSIQIKFKSRICWLKQSTVIDKYLQEKGWTYLYHQ